MITLAMLDSVADKDLQRVFKWQALVGLGPKFGSRPIGWYQMHHCAVSKEILAAAKNAGVCQPEYALTTHTTAFDNRGLYVVPCNADGRTNGLASTYLGDVDRFYRDADIFNPESEL